MKKQFFRVKQLADQTFLKAEKSDIFNHGELHIADQKVEYLRAALSAITKKIAPNGIASDVEKSMKKNADYQLGVTFLEESKLGKECPLFQNVLKECGTMEQQLAREFAEHEKKIEEMVLDPLELVMENDFPNILKHKHNLRKYCLDKDSASNRYQATGKDNVREDMEEADTKVEQTRDALATEMFSVLAKENEISQYILQFLKLQRSYHEGALKSLENLIPELEKKIGNSSVRRVFGTPLEEHLRITGKRIAYPLEICVTALREYAMSEEGLFRVAASTLKVKRLRASIDSGCFTVLIPEYRDAHILASLLKLYLRELPEPLLTYHLHKDWLEAAQAPENDRLRLVRETIDKLPQANRDNLSYLCRFLSQLTRHPENKMSSSNIAIVLSPNLLWNKQESFNMDIGNCVTGNVLVELFIKEIDTLFPEDVSSFVHLPAEIFQEEDYSMYRGHTAGGDAGGHVGSPRPNQRKKKSAPVPPTISRPLESRQIASRDDDVTAKASPEPKVRRADEPAQKPPGQRLDRATTTEDLKVPSPQPRPSIKPVEKVYTTSAVHKVNQASNTQSVIVDNKRETAVLSPKPLEFPAVEEGQLRRKEPGVKPEIPARPSSLSAKPPAEVDRVFKKTQCSVYNVANKQQPSYINIHGKPEQFQLGHDNNINEKERFLGHEPISPGRGDNNANNGNNTNLTTNDVPHQIHNLSFADNNDQPSEPPNKITAKSIDNINRGTTPGDSDKPKCDNDANVGSQRTTHARARSDGSVIDLERGSQTVAHFATRNLPKPSQPPPPPPGS